MLELAREGGGGGGQFALAYFVLQLPMGPSFCPTTWTSSNEVQSACRPLGANKIFVTYLGASNAVVLLSLALLADCQTRALHGIGALQLVNGNTRAAPV